MRNRKPLKSYFSSNLEKKLNNSLEVRSSVLINKINEHEYEKSYFVYHRLISDFIMNPIVSENSIKYINKFERYQDYSSSCKVLPVPCFDFLLSYQGKVALIKRSIWPMHGYWWLVGGRRIISKESQFNLGSTIADEILWKLTSDLNIKSNSIKKIGVISESDHYHFKYHGSECVDQRLTPVKTYVVELNDSKELSLPATEASEIIWVDEQGLDRLSSLDLVPDHVRILLFLFFGFDSLLRLEYY